MDAYTQGRTLEVSTATHTHTPNKDNVKETRPMENR